MNDRRDRKVERTTGVAALVGSSALIAYWTLYFTGVARPSGDAMIEAFEAAFPFADAVLAGTLLVAGLSLLRGAPWGPFLFALGAAACLYLGLVDLAFYGSQGHYSQLTGQAVFEAVANGACLVGGSWGVRRAWTLWAAGATRPARASRGTLWIAGAR